MRVFLEKVVLHLPGIVNAQAVRQLDLIQRVLEEAELGAWLPGTRQLMLVEDPEFHGRSFTGPALRGLHPKTVAEWPPACMRSCGARCRGRLESCVRPVGALRGTSGPEEFRASRLIIRTGSPSQ